MCPCGSSNLVTSDRFHESIFGGVSTHGAPKSSIWKCKHEWKLSIPQHPHVFFVDILPPREISRNSPHLISRHSPPNKFQKSPDPPTPIQHGLVPPFTLHYVTAMSPCPTYLSLSDIVDMKNALDFYVTSGPDWGVEYLNFSLFGALRMVGWLDGWMVGWLDGWMVGCGKVDISGRTLWLKPIEQLENPPFWWYLPGRKRIFHGYLRCGSAVIMWTIFEVTIMFQVFFPGVFLVSIFVGT